MRIATWNLLWRFGDWRPRQPLIDAALSEQAADVVLLQETWPEQAERVAAHLELDLLAFEGGHFDQTLSSVPTDAFFGNAVMARADLGATLVHRAPFSAAGDPAPRNLLVVEVGDMAVATSHLSHMGDAHDLRAGQLAHVASVLDEIGAPSLFCGDHNLVPWSPEHTAAEQLGFVDTWLAANPDPSTIDEFGATMNPENPEIASAGWMDDRNEGHAPKGSGIRLDYVWARAGSDRPAPNVEHLTRFGRGEGGRWPSDHLGLAFEVV